ncbi:hypothetical protein IWQ62_002221 [Dispira parvispora]|uniref:Urease accessory protein UreF n=1 Tax=Dispira parvispora TaxID=1520584 RepID=A0A9W8E425_9FUNG|nr:hypothetical protein IWQ62_002221 [Dispira parvispora]
MIEEETWLIWQLVDSALPTGGFVASSGLETAFQLGYVTTPKALDRFIASSVHTYAHSSLPFVTDAYLWVQDHSPDTLAEKTLGQLKSLDQLYHIQNTHAAVRRASVAQGSSLLTLYLKSFTNCPNDQLPKLVREYKSAVRQGTAQGHFPVSFGLVAYCLGLSLEKTQQLFLFMFVRQIISAAVRLNIAGPYHAQIALTTAKVPTERVLTMTRALRSHEACQTSPTVDVFQGTHDRLYSRIFNS